jgi:hypothetical protein
LADRRDVKREREREREREQNLIENVGLVKAAF